MKIKITILNLTVLVFLFFLPACKNDNNIDLPAKQNISFSFEQIEVQILSSARQKVAASKADARYVVVTIENSTGTKIYDAKKLELYNFNGSFISESLSLDVADYKLTSFLVLDVNNIVIYSTPLEGSALANQVIDPLPINFTVSKDQVAKITPEVLTSAGVPVSDFGYASFDFDVMIPFRISVQIYDAVSASWGSSIANISVVGINTKVGTLGDTSLYKGTITKGTNIISIKEGYPYYGISLSKDSYSPQFIILTNAQLKTYLNTPLLFSLLEGGTVTDVEGNVYKVITIGTQTWMAENLKVTHYQNGDIIPNETDLSKWGDFQITKGAWCWYKNDPSYKNIYGALYNWYAASDRRNIAPVGWHVPGKEDWLVLEKYVNPFSMNQSNGGYQLCEMTTAHWKNAGDISADTNQTGFTALPAGKVTQPNFGFMDLGASYAYFWTSTGTMDGSSCVYLNSKLEVDNMQPNCRGFSIRCIKD